MCAKCILSTLSAKALWSVEAKKMNINLSSIYAYLEELSVNLNEAEYQPQENLFTSQIPSMFI